MQLDFLQISCTCRKNWKVFVGNFAAPPSDFPTCAGRFRKGHFKLLVKFWNISATFESEGLFHKSDAEIYTHSCENFSYFVWRLFVYSSYARIRMYNPCLKVFTYRLCACFKACMCSRSTQWPSF